MYVQAREVYVRSVEDREDSSKRRSLLARMPFFAPLLCFVFVALAEIDAFASTTRPQGEGGSLADLPSIKAAVIVPGFLTGKAEFLPLAQSLTAMGIPSVVVPFPNWHWLPCLGGRSMRPMLERIDMAVRHRKCPRIRVSLATLL